MCLHITEITGAAMLHVIVSGDAVDGVVQFKPCSMLLPLEQEDLMCLHITEIPGAAMIHALASGDAVDGVVQ